MPQTHYRYSGEGFYYCCYSGLAIWCWFGGRHFDYLCPFRILLILFRKVTDKGLVRWAIAFASIPLVLSTLFAGLMYLAMSIPEAAQQAQAGIEQSMAQTLALCQRPMEAYSAGSFIDVVKIRIAEYTNLTIEGLFFFYPVAMTLFLLVSWRRAGVF